MRSSALEEIFRDDGTAETHDFASKIKYRVLTTYTRKAEVMVLTSEYNFRELEWIMV